MCAVICFELCLGQITAGRECQEVLALTASRCGARLLFSRVWMRALAELLLCWKRHDSLPVSTMWQ